MEDGSPEDLRPVDQLQTESTAHLITRIRAGDDAARECLILRYLPPLQRWARGRLPGWARGHADTDDIVQETLIRALQGMESFESRYHGAFLAYLRRILLNRIRDEIRQVSRRVDLDTLPTDVPHNDASPLERAIGRERLEAYEKALTELTADQQEAVILKIEMGMTHSEVAEAMGTSTPEAARMLVRRGLVRLTQAMARQ